MSIVVNCNKLILDLVGNRLVLFIGVCCNCYWFTWFLVKNNSYGDLPSAVVASEIYDEGNNLTFVEHSVYRVSFQLRMHLRYSCNE